MKKYLLIVTLVAFSFICIQDAISGALARGFARVAIGAGRKLIEGFSLEIGKELAKETIDSFSEKEEQQSAEAQYRLGWKYDEQKSYSKSFYWIEKAAYQGLAKAQRYLGYMYDYGDGVTKSVADAVYWYRKAIEQGDEHAEKLLGNLETVIVQKSLYRLGYYNGPIDGKFGPKTGNAIRQYQSYNGLYVNGRVTESLLERLGLRF